MELFLTFGNGLKPSDLTFIPEPYCLVSFALARRIGGGGIAKGESESRDMFLTEMSSNQDS